MNDKVLGIIPARFGSTRFPGKALASLSGKTLLQWTYESAQKCQAIETIVVATDDERILDHVKSFGGSAVMTSPDCPSGTDRLAEVMQSGSFDEFNIVVNIQGDEPLIAAETLESVIASLKNSEAPMATAAAILDNPQDILNPNIVKVVLDRQGHALYFSRAPIPGSKSGHAKALRHIGLYAFRREFLLKYPTLPPTPLQQTEDLEQLKVLEHGHSIRVAIVNEIGVGVDTPEDLQTVERILCQRNTSLSPAASSRH